MNDHATVLITGGTRGLGRALARILASRGMHVAIVARDQAAVDATVAELEELGGTALGIVADVGHPSSAERIAAVACAAFGRVDVLIHNAGSLGAVPLPNLLEMEPADLEAAFRVNTLGPVALTRALVGGMLLRRRGLIVHLGSDASVEAYPTWGAYGASKAAIEHISRTLAVELQGTGVRVLTVDPGEMNTQMHADAVPQAEPQNLADPADVARVLVQILEDEDGAPSGARIEAASWTARRSA
jgi:NAD(P)-dependent dehydrogenase (short-subunit alcohol dehydrogenase family)